jgi:hypothetical protein
MFLVVLFWVGDLPLVRVVAENLERISPKGNI